MPDKILRNILSEKDSGFALEAGAAPDQADGGEPVRPIRALLRGLETLAALNRVDGLTVSEVSHATGLPRTTTYRILETLCSGGYVARDEGDERYRPTARTGGLAGGFQDEPWVRDEAAPRMEALCRAIYWPIMFSTPAGAVLRLRAVTDKLSPLALRRYAPGSDLALTDTAAGMARLSVLRPAERDALLAGVVSRETGQAPSEADLDHVRRGAEQAAAQGFALDTRAVAGEASLAVVVRDRRDAVRGLVCLRFIRSALTPERVITDLLPHLRKLAEDIGASAPVDMEARLDVFASA